MALTQGKKTTVVTPSSVANRMGVVDAYKGDWVAAAAEQFGKTIDVITQQKVTQEEELYKAKFSIDTFDAIKGFANKNRVDPDGYYNSVNPYIDTLIKKVPTRFKGWAKQYAGMMAAREGQDIHLRHYNKKQQDLIKYNNIDTDRWINDALDKLSAKDISEWDNEMTNFYLPELTDKTVSYASIYASLDPQFSAGLDAPEIWAKKKILGFEQARVNTKIKSIYAGAIVKDQESLTYSAKYPNGIDLNGDGIVAEPIGSEAGALSYLEQAQKDVALYLKNYQTNPDQDMLDGFSTLLAAKNDQEFSMFSTAEERANIIDNATIYGNNLIEENKRLQSKIDNQNKANHQNAVNQFLQRLDFPYLLPNSKDELIKNFNDLNISAEDRITLTDKYEYNDTINKYAELLMWNPNNEGKRFIYKEKYVDLPDLTNAWADVTSRAMAELKAKGFEITAETEKEIQKSMVDTHVYHLTGKMPNEFTFQWDMFANEPSPDLEALKQYATRWNIVPEPLSRWLGDWKHMNYELETDRNQLIEMAHAMHYLRSSDIPQMMEIEGIDSKDAIMLDSFYQDYQKRKTIIDNTQATPESQKITESEFVERWWKARDAKIDDIDILNKEINTMFTRLDDDYFAKALKEQIDKTKFSLFAADYGSMAIGIGEAKVKPLFEFSMINPLSWLPLVKTDTEAVDLNLELAGRELENILPDIITDFYISQNLTARDLAQRPKWQIEKDIKTILQWGIRDLANQGWDTDD